VAAATDREYALFISGLCIETDSVVSLSARPIDPFWL
jgi:hypothetical protein